LASSSRSQVLAGTASAAARLAWDRPSVDVRWRPLLAVAIVTHLVTQSFVRARATCWPSALALCITSVSRALLAGSSLLRCRRLLTLAVGSRCCRLPSPLLSVPCTGLSFPSLLSRGSIIRLELA